MRVGKLLYEDAAHHNAVFVGTDEGGCPRHAHLRSTNSFGKAFRLNVESSDPRYSFHHTGTDGSLYVFEAPIDMLSYISMNPHQWQEHSYVACCGTSPIPVMQMLKPDTQIVYLCLDNDDAGHKASERMAELLHERGVMTERLVPELKDWNEDLLARAEGGFSPMPESVTPLIAVGVVIVLFIVLLSALTNNCSLNGIKSKTVGDGQHGTARWATTQEIKKIVCQRAV